MGQSEKWCIVEYDVLFRPKILRGIDEKPLVFDLKGEAEILADGIMFPAGRFVHVLPVPDCGVENVTEEDFTISGLSHEPSIYSCTRAAGCFASRKAAQKSKAKEGSA